MKLSQLSELLVKGEALQSELLSADYLLRQFNAVEGDVVRCQAFACKPGEQTDYGRRASVDVLPIPKEMAISAVKRMRTKIVRELAALGIDVDEPDAGSAPAHGVDQVG